jgi:sirohydrochlorin ferrochelatase
MADSGRIALVLAAHGDRGGSDRNAVLRRHASSLRGRGRFEAVTFGVLNGQPPLVHALKVADGTSAARLVVYPFFMSGGYFVRKVLPERIGQVKLVLPVQILEPLGLDPSLPGLLLRNSLKAARDAAFEPKTARLVIAGHGSKFGRASAQATEAIADAVRSKAVFAKVTAAFLEEAPFITDTLKAENMPMVVAGFFSGEGMHGHDDVIEVIKMAAGPCVYTRPIGGDPDIPELIEAAVLNAAPFYSA